MNKFKVNDRVKFKRDALNMKVEDKGTIMETNYDGDNDLLFINTDKLNAFNHPKYNGNGLLVVQNDLSLLIRTGKWSIDEINYLHSFYRRKSVSDIAFNLNRSYFAVQSKARSEKIHKHPRREYNEGDNRTIVHMFVDNIGNDSIGAQLHRCKNSINGRIALMANTNMLPVMPK